MGAITVVTTVVGLAATWHLLRRYFVPSKSLMDEPQTEEKKQSEGNRGTNELQVIAPTFNSNAFDALGNAMESLPEVHRTSDSTSNFSSYRGEGFTFNSTAFDALEWRKPVLDKVMEALADPNTHLIGVYGSDDEIKDTLLQRVCRRVKRDTSFDMVVTVPMVKRPDVSKIQKEIACQLGFNFNEKSNDKRANELLCWIKNKHKVLIVLRDLQKSLDLGKVGIPFGVDHIGCKILLTSISEEVLSNQMHTQKNFMV